MPERKVGPKAEQTRQMILEVAIRHYGLLGYQSSSLAAIARDAGVSRTLAYAYFDDGDALFQSALDRDSAEFLEQALTPLAESTPTDMDWENQLLPALLTALDDHPLTRRVLAGHEPHVTTDMLKLPALEMLREEVVRRLKESQLAGLVRADVDPEAIGRGSVNIWIGILMSIVQFGGEGIHDELWSIRAFYDAAILPRT